MYKPSMFNIIHRRTNGNLRLFNSYEGLRSLLEVDSENKQYVDNLLLKKELHYPENNSVIFDKLVELGYIVPKETNEKIKRAFRRNNVINNKALSLMILPTEQCNFRCRYCYEEFRKGKMSEELQSSIVKFIQKNIQHYTGLNVSWFGGEPLEALDVIENLSNKFIKICNVAKKTYSSSMTTNAYNLSLETFKLLHSLNVFYYQITLDGPKETHDNQRPHVEGYGTFDRIISNLLSIKENMKTQFFTIVLRTNYSIDIYERIDEYIEFLDKNFSSDNRFNISIHMASNWGGERAKEFEGQVLDNTAFSDVLKVFSTKSHNLNLNFHLEDLTPFRSMCYANFRNSYIIGSDGSIYKCSANFTNPNNIIGCINKNGDMNIDESKHALWICNQNIETEICTNCSFSACCLGTSCPSKHIFNPDSKVNCPRTRLFIHDLLEMFNEKAFIKI